MNFWELIISNKIINAAVIAWFVAQSLKVVFVLIEKKRLDFSRLVGSGGMPSSHSSTMMALVTMIARMHGFGSTFFAISVIIALVVMYDATGVRRAAGKQAAVLNKMMENIGVQHDPDYWGGKLKELIGHTPFQVFVGAILGIIISFLIPI
ncbi:MAG: divergent PAP2 family protein [Oscillospiraceae bacterium]|nr:divergent PAP2 family protein [Oscillospiraceae bacterium]